MSDYKDFETELLLELRASLVSEKTRENYVSINEKLADIDIELARRGVYNVS